MSSDPSFANAGWAGWWNRTRYQLYAPIYDAVARPLEQGRKQAIERLNLGSGDRILILGCGTGSDLKYLPRGTKVTAVDAAPAMVRRTRDRAERLGMKVDARVGDAQALPFEEGAFDAVLLHLILSVVPDPQAVAAETARVLAPGGRVSVYDKFAPQNEESSLLRRALNPAARFLFSDLTRRLEPLLSSAGLEVKGPRETVLGGLYTVAVATHTSAEE
jgi:phosphatidylethanolamine/phosphatidyl-N-methylethanolamine N-methyltransferase